MFMIRLFAEFRLLNINILVYNQQIPTLKGYR